MVGGLVATGRSTIIDNCKSSGSVSAGWMVGGLVGALFESTITNSSSSAKVLGLKDPNTGIYEGAEMGGELDVVNIVKLEIVMQLVKWLHQQKVVVL